MVFAKKINKIINKSALFLLLVMPALLSSCGTSINLLPRPENTNLHLWLTQKVTEDDLINMTYLPGMLGGEKYLDYSYALEEGELGNTLPKEYVSYEITSYPNYSDGGTYVTKIVISDPKISFYGLTINSTISEFDDALSKSGFQYEVNDSCSSCMSYWVKDNFSIQYKSSLITLVAKVTNRNNIIF